MWASGLKARIVGLFAALAVIAGVWLAVGGTASAHETSDAAPDTPFAGVPALDHGLPHFLDALEHSHAVNALLRNPTCGAHHSGDGIHPPGNP